MTERVISRAFRIGRSLLQVHVDVASKELSRDASRLTSAAIMIGVAIVMLSTAWLVLNAAAAAAMVFAGLAWHWALLIVVAVDVVVGVALALVAKQRFAEPVVPQTRQLIRQTVGALTQ